MVKRKKLLSILRNYYPFLFSEGQDTEFFIACEKEMLKRRGVIRSAGSRGPWTTLDDTIKGLLTENLARLNII